MSSILGFGTDGDGDGTVLDAMVKLLVCDPPQCGREGLASLVGRSLRVRAWLDALDARIAARASRLAASGESADAASVLVGGGRRRRRDAEAAAERGSVCERMPHLADALANGVVSAGHVDAVADAARRLDEQGRAQLADHEASLVDAAARLTPEEFERECRDLARNLSGDDELSRHERLRRQRNVARWVDKHTGMCKTMLSLDPLDDAKVWATFHAAVAQERAGNQDGDERTWDQLQADAIVGNIVRPVLREGEAAPGGSAAEVSVLIDARALIEGGHASVAETADGQPLPIEVIRRLGCDGFLVPIWLGGGGEVLAVGRQRRLATRAQRRALRAMYRTCAHPGCTVGFETCRIHHVTYWERFGPTDLDNLVPLCERHHHMVHEGGWTLRLFADRRVTWLAPDASVYYDGVTTDRSPTATEFPTRCRGPRHGAFIVDDGPIVAATAVAELDLAIAAAIDRAPP